MDELRLPVVALRWIDIEDEPEWGGEHDFTSLPMVVIKVDGHTVFAGSVEPISLKSGACFCRFNMISACAESTDRLLGSPTWTAVAR